MNAWLKLRNALVVSLVLALGLGLVVNYWVYLKRDELRAWKELDVLFQDVGGLKLKDPVTFNGARIGRVSAIRFHEARYQRVTLQYEGDLQIHEVDSEIAIVPLNALGRVVVAIIPGDSSSPVIPKDRLIEGIMREAIGSGGGTPTPGRQKLIKQQIESYARETRRALRPDGSSIGGLLFSTARRTETREGLANLARTWKGIDRALGDFEARQAREGMLSKQSYLIAADTLASFERSMRQLRNGFREVEAGRGSAGWALADPNAALQARQVVQDQAEGLVKVRRHEGTLGRLVDPELDAGESLLRSVEEWELVSKEGDAGRGVLGTLSSPAQGEGFSQGLRGMEATFRRFREAQAKDTARAEVEDGLGNLDDFLIKAKRALEGLRRGLPDKNFQGAVFAVF